MRSNTEQIPLNIYSSGSSPEDDTPHIPVDQTFMVPKKEIRGVVLGLFVFMFSFQPIEKLLALLETLDRSIDETPPADQLSRLGDKAYCAWYAKLDQEAEALVAEVFPENKAAATPEIAVYLKEAAGNSTRIDYGTVLVSSAVVQDYLRGIFLAFCNTGRIEERSRC
uniref:Serine/threonine-protein phosphatase 2A activator n=1 Tax=Oncorhynchus tshawytscha TaxID=74940 RepID=A0A8C8HUB0_ONCTS